MSKKTSRIHGYLESIDQIGKSGSLQWIPARAGNEGNEAANDPLKMATLLNNCNITNLLTHTMQMSFPDIDLETNLLRRSISYVK